MSNVSLAAPYDQQTILVTGGAGYIGSHTCVELLDRGYNVVIIDDLSNSHDIAINRVHQITGADENRLVFKHGSIFDYEMLDDLFDKHNFNAIIHFAGFKAVGESTKRPLEYYWNNIGGSLVLFDVARKHGVKNIIFSSSATVCGEPEFMPMTEDTPMHTTTNPYAETKAMLERILTDLYRSDNEWNIAILRYFNPIGAHESGLIGEDPQGIPNNLLPYVAQVATGKLESIGVFGNDYPTPDGTGVRDYIHVVDLARGHACALDWMAGRCGTGEANDRGSIPGEPMPCGTRSGVGLFNLGTGKGTSVLEVIASFEKACGRKLPCEIKPRRAGDMAMYYASSEKAARELGWVAEYDLDRMCEDIWRWQSHNPNGYRA